MPVSAPGTVGRTDRVARLIVGAVLIGFALFCPWAAELGTGVQLVSGIVGAVLAVTAAFGICPLYRMLGVCTG